MSDKPRDRAADIPGELRMIRPEAVVLPDDAVVSASDAPTHVLTRAAPYYLDASKQATRPDGHFDAGTRVTVLDGAPARFRRVRDASGLCADVRTSDLTTLP